MSVSVEKRPGPRVDCVFCRWPTGFWFKNHMPLCQVCAAGTNYNEIDGISARSSFGRVPIEALDTREQKKRAARENREELGDL